MKKGKEAPKAKPAPSRSGPRKAKELSKEELGKVAGGRLGGDDDLKDLEVERFRRR